MNALTFPLLRQLADGQFHSGERLARHFGVSRTTVWNAMREAKALGVALFSIPGRGYRLPQPVQFLRRDAVRQALGGAAAFRLEFHDQLPSTNSYLMRQAADGGQHGTCVVAELQTHGRGRRGRGWLARLGDSLTFSVLWRFERGAGALSGLSLAVGIALLRALGELGAQDIRLKWPNDLLHEQRKLAGILVELQGDMDGPSAAVIGIGLNLCLPPAMRAAIGQPASSLDAVVGQLTDSALVLGVLLRHLADVLGQFERTGFAPLREEWVAHHAFQGKAVRLHMPDGSETGGIAVGVADDGALLVHGEQGLQRFATGEISLRGAA